MIPSRFSFFQPVIIKIGSSRTIILTSGRKTLIDEPARIALSLVSGEAMGFGAKAASLDFSGSFDIDVSPLFWRGIPQDEAKCVKYVYSLRKKLSTTFKRKILPIPAVLVVPSEFPTPYKKIFTQVLREANFLPIATVSQIFGEFRYAVGNTVPEHTVVMIRIGESLTQVGLYTGGTEVFTCCLPAGGSDLDQLLQIYIHATYGVIVSQHSLPPLKELYVKAKASQSQFSAVLRGKDIHTGVLRSVQLSDADMSSVCSQFFAQLSSAVGFRLRSYQEIIAATHPPVSLFLSGGLSVIPEAKTSFAKALGRTPELVSRPHIASVLGAATSISHQDV
ncbi:MAG: rod shape-determining protein [Candidatus Woesebacteria bacterium]